MRKFRSTEFDWATHRVRLGNIWKDSEAAVEGGDPLSRAEVACLEVYHCEDVCLASTIVKSDLDFCQREQLNELLAEYSCVFAENPKKPAITSMTKHRIDTRGSYPVKQTVRRVSPAMEREKSTSRLKTCSQMVFTGRRTLHSLVG